MSKLIHIAEPAEIASILDIIHDCWFDKDDIVYNPEKLILSFKFLLESPEHKKQISKVGFVKKMSIPYLECFLQILHVKTYHITDKENVGKYDFNELKYDADQNKICITTGIPLDIEVFVDSFEVQVEITDKIIKEKASLSLF